MPYVGIRELQRDTSGVLERVIRGTRIVITRHNRPVAVVVGIADAKETIRKLDGPNRIEKGALLRDFERWIWSDEIRPLNITIAELSGKRPVREFPQWGE